MITTHFDRVEADLARYYHTDLPDGLWGDRPMTVRRLGVLLRSLPADSATARAVRMTPPDTPMAVKPLRRATADDIAAFGGKVTYVEKGAG